MRSRFDQQLALLKQRMTEMGALCENVIALSAKALLDGDSAMARQAAPIDHEIDQMEREIEGICLKLLLQQQPVARDLRQISAALKMITDMERIGDQAEDIAEIIPYLNGRCGEEFQDIRTMAQATIRMVTDSMEAYIKPDLELSRAVTAYDDVVDDCFIRLKRHLIGTIAANPEGGEYALDLLMIGKYFERIGDHATNIAEWVVFSITGVHETEEDDDLVR